MMAGTTGPNKTEIVLYLGASWLRSTDTKLLNFFPIMAGHTG